MCGEDFRSEGNRKVHRRTCGGGSMDGHLRQCGGCRVWITRGNYARHVRRCRTVRGEDRELGDVREGGGVGGGEGSSREAPRGRRGPCPSCGVALSLANMARHLRGCRRVWDPGGGATPLTGVNG